MPKSKKPHADEKTTKVEHSPPQRNLWQHAVIVLLIGLVLAVWIAAFLTMSLLFFGFALMATAVLIFSMVVVWRADSIKDASISAGNTRIGITTRGVKGSLGKARRESMAMNEKMRASNPVGSKSLKVPGAVHPLKRNGKRGRRR